MLWNRCASRSVMMTMKLKKLLATTGLLTLTLLTGACGHHVTTHHVVVHHVVVHHVIHHH